MQWSPDGMRLSFDVIDADGSGVRRLGAGIAACWSPDGSRILFTDGLVAASPLYVMDADGSHRRELAAVSALEPNWR